MKDFILVGKKTRPLIYLANTLRPHKVILERHPYSRNFWRRKLFSLDPLTVLVNAWLNYRFRNHPTLAKRFEYEPQVIVTDRVRARDIRDNRCCLFGSSIVRAKAIAAAKEIVNLHLGYLPLYQGCKPEVWALATGGKTGVSLHEVTPEIDAGVILLRRFVLPDETIIQTKLKLLRVGSSLIESWLTGNFPKPLVSEKAHYYSTPSWETVWSARRSKGRRF